MVAETHYRCLYKNFLNTPQLFDLMIEPEPNSLEEFRLRCLEKENDKSRVYFVASKADEPGEYIGLCCIACVDQKNRKMELGRGFFSHLLQRTMASTELFFLLIRYSFELGYLRVFMRTSPKNTASMHMMSRLGFSLEGTFRSDFILDGYAIDCVTYSILEYEWPTAKKAMEEWLLPENFDSQGKQKKPLQIIYEHK